MKSRRQAVLKGFVPPPPAVAGERRGRHLEQAASVRRPLGCLVKARPAGLRPWAVRAHRPRGDGHVHRLRPTGAAVHRHARAARRARDRPFLARRPRPGDLAQVPPDTPMRSRQRACPLAPSRHSTRCAAGPIRLSFLPFLSSLLSHCPARRRGGAGRRDPYGFGPPALTFFKLFGPFSRQAGRPEAGDAGRPERLCARRRHRVGYVRSSNPAPRGACASVPKQAPSRLSPDRAAGAAGRARPGRRRSGALLPDALRQSRLFPQGKSAGRVLHRLPLPGAPR